MTDSKFLTFHHLFDLQTISFFSRRFPGINIDENNWEMIWNHLELSDNYEFKMALAFANFIIKTMNLSFDMEQEILNLLLYHMKKENFQILGPILFSIALDKDPLYNLNNDSLPKNLIINNERLVLWKDLFQFLQSNDHKILKTNLNNDKNEIIFTDFMFHNYHNSIHFNFSYDGENIKSIENQDIILKNLSLKDKKISHTPTKKKSDQIDAIYIVHFV